MRHALCASALFLLCCQLAVAQEKAVTEKEPLPKVGDEAADFTLTVLGREEDEANLHTQLEERPVVLLVLRGYPGYQCPICSRQMGQYLRAAETFAERGAAVWMVYPGPAEDLERYALEFVEDREFPKHYKMLLDPDYEFTNAWNLRWDAPRETAYPSTFVIGTDKEIKFAKISKEHGGRTRPDEVLEAVPAKSE